MPDILKLTPSESLEVRASTPEAFEVEATYGPAGSPSPKHFHPAQDEHFEVLAGRTEQWFRAIDWLLRPLFAGLAVLGRARGYSATP